MKTCSKCKISKSETEFGRDVTRNGLRRYCKLCWKEYSRKLSQTTRYKLWRSKYERSQAGKIVKRRYESGNKHKLLKWKREIFYRYGLSYEDYLNLFKAQGSKCAICERILENGRRLHVDHCHKSNKVRGLLCGNCNGGLGLFLDDSKLLIKAISYLAQHKSEVAA